MIEDSSSHDVLIRTQYKRVLSLACLLLADYQEAQDVAQEVFYKLLKASEEHQPIRSWEAWLTRVTINCCHDRRRSAGGLWRRNNVEELQEEALPSHILAPEAALLHREALEQCYRAIEALPTRQRVVFILRRIYGWSNMKVATVLGLTTGSVKRHLFHAVRHVQQRLERTQGSCDKMP